MRALMWIRMHWKDHGTKAIGFAQGLVGTLAGYEVIPATHLKYYLAGSAVITFARGFFNSNQIQPPPT